MQTQVLNIIQEFYYESQKLDKEHWSVNNIQKLIPFVTFNQIKKILVWFFFALDHPSVLLEPEDPLNDIIDEYTHQQHLSELF